MKPTTLPDPYMELGRRLLAAVLSYQLGIGLEYALKNYVPREIDPSWGELGHALLSGVLNKFNGKIRNQLPPQ
jgi:hypothetical protein